MDSLINRFKKWLIIKLGGYTAEPKVQLVRSRTAFVAAEEFVDYEFLYNSENDIQEIEASIREHLAFDLMQKMLERGLIGFKNGIGRPEKCQESYIAYVRVYPPRKETEDAET